MVGIRVETDELNYLKDVLRKAKIEINDTNTNVIFLNHDNYQQIINACRESHKKSFYQKTKTSVTMERVFALQTLIGKLEPYACHFEKEMGTLQ